MPSPAIIALLHRAAESPHGIVVSFAGFGANAALNALYAAMRSDEAPKEPALTISRPPKGSQADELWITHRGGPRDE